MSDNNRVNRNMLNELVKHFRSEDSFKIENPKYQMLPLFLTYDTVHIFKNLRNNWINEKDFEKTFFYPDFI